MKYQFCVRFNNVDANSAASKAVLDCNRIFSEAGYQDFTFTVGDNSRKFSYYLSLFKGLVSFFFAIKRNSLVGIQYPLLSVNSVFATFMKAARQKNVRFFCIVHDLESLRTGGQPDAVKKEIERLNAFDHLIVHNQRMRGWLANAGVIRPMLLLDVFDYLAKEVPVNPGITNNQHIVYAGNLLKSGFVNNLGQLGNVPFNLYGPGFNKQLAEQVPNVHWQGEYSPEEIPAKLTGAFGLIWDGNHIDRCDELLGNYLRYNNPHKFSLYLAAGLPVIAPKDSAIGNLIVQYNLGVLIDSLYDLTKLSISNEDYTVMLENVRQMRTKIIGGHYFKKALATIEQQK